MRVVIADDSVLFREGLARVVHGARLVAGAVAEHGHGRVRLRARGLHAQRVLERGACLRVEALVAARAAEVHEEADLVLRSLRGAVNALVAQDAELADEVIAFDDEVDSRYFSV